MSTTDDLRAIRDMVHDIDVGLAEVMAWLDGVIERTDAPADRRDVLAEITRDETADGPRADGPRADGFPANDTTVVRDDGAGKGSTARSLPPLAGADASDVSVEGRSENGPQKGVQRLGDDLRDEASELCALANGKPYVVGVRPQDLIGIAQELDDYAARADALTAERDRLAADIAIMRDADLTATDVQRRRAEKAEAAVARVRALVHDTSARVGALMFTPMTRARQYVTGVTLDDLRAALDEEGV